MESWTEADNETVKCIVGPYYWQFDLTINMHSSRNNIIDALADRGVSLDYYKVYDSKGHEIFVNAHNLLEAKVINFLRPAPDVNIYVKSGHIIALMSINILDDERTVSNKIKSALSIDSSKYDYMVRGNRKLPRHGQLVSEVRKVLGGEPPTDENTLVLRPI